jgi:hypothetical protein
MTQNFGAWRVSGSLVVAGRQLQAFRAELYACCTRAPTLCWNWLTHCCAPRRSHRLPT